MSKRTLFHLLVRIVAVAVVLFGVSSLIQIIGNTTLVLSITRRTLTVSQTVFQVLASVFGTSVMLMAAVQLYWTATRLEIWVYGVERCPECDFKTIECRCGFQHAKDEAMSPRVFFQTALRAVGLLVLLFAIPQVCNIVLGFLHSGSASMFADMGHTVASVSIMVSTALSIVAGLYLLKGGGRLVRLIYPIEEIACGRCGTNLMDVESSDCPYCNASIAENSRVVVR